MSNKTLAEKLVIREGYTVLVLNPPKGYKDALGPLPIEARVVAKSAAPVDFIQVFAPTRAEMIELLAQAKPLLKEQEYDSHGDVDGERAGQGRPSPCRARKPLPASVRHAEGKSALGVARVGHLDLRAQPAVRTGGTLRVQCPGWHWL